MINEKFLETLYQQLPEWEKQQIISAEQSQNIKKYYDVEWKVPAYRSNRFIEVLTVIWALFVWIWVILFFAANWDAISDLIKTLLLMSSIIVTYWIWIYLYYINGSYQKTWYALMILWSLLYGSSIFLLWQIYNLGWEFYEWMLLWCLWVIPIAYATRFSLLLILAIVLFLVYIFVYVGDIFYPYELFYGLLIWLIWVLFVNLSKVHINKYWRFGFIYNVLWIIWIFISMFLITFKDFLFTNYMYDSIYTSNTIFSNPMSILWILAILALITKSYTYWNRLFKSIFSELFDIVPALILVAIALNLPYFVSPSDYFENITVLVINLFFIIFIIYSIYIWISDSKTSYINVSIIFLVFFMFAKYFDWFYSMMERSIFFILWWVLLIALWFGLEKLRKRLISIKI